MEVDISRELLKRKALDRWENEGGSVPTNGKELITTDSTKSAQTDSELRTHPPVETRSYSTGTKKDAVYEH